MFLSGVHDLLMLTMKEMQKTDISKIELHVGKEDISPDKYEIQLEEVLIFTGDTQHM